jgi:hypothetical protein
MTDLEQSLRSELLTTAADYELVVDPQLVLSAGRNRRRVRSAHRLVLAGILAVAISLAGVVAAPRIIAAILEKQTLEFSERFEWDGARAEFDQFTVRLVDEDGVHRLNVTAYRAHAEVATLTEEIPATGASRFRLGGRTVVAVFPGQVKGVEIVTDASVGTESSWASAFDRTVVIGMLFEPVKAPERLDWLWVDDGGTMRHADGTTVPSAKITIRGVDNLVYRNERTDELGLWGRSRFSLNDYAETDLLHGGMHRESDGASESWQYGALPVGAHDVRVTLSRPDGDWGWATLSDGTVVVLAIVPGEPENVVTGFSYRRADGTPVTHGR